MRDKLSEQLSALVDDELDSDEQALLLRQLGKDAALRRQFARYQLASDALKDNLPEYIDPGFHLRVQEALRDVADPQPSIVGRHLGGLLRPVAGLAIAASVATVAVLSLQSVRETAPQSVPVIASTPAPDDYIRAEGSPPPVAVTATPGRTLDAYLVNHNEHAVNRGVHGMLPYVRIIGQQVPASGRETAE